MLEYYVVIIFLISERYRKTFKEREVIKECMLYNLNINIKFMKKIMEGNILKCL